MSFWKNKPLIVAIALAIVLVVLLFATSGHNAKENSNSLIGSIIAPMQEGIYTAANGTGEFFKRLFGATDLDKENLELRERIAELESQTRDYNTVVKENERLKELLNVKDTMTEYDVLTAQVIGKNDGRWFTEFTVNAGSEDGIKPDMIVLTQDGLLGKVTSVYDTYSRIITLINTSSGVPAMVERSRDYGVIKAAADTGDKEAGMLTLEYVSQNADIVPGDTIITSGMGGLYPKGIYIGQVTEVGTLGESSAVSVQSFVDYERIEEVVIVLESFEEAGN